jgi:protein-S-isoprenylcysteine O-methyltransferase Ste14
MSTDSSESINKYGVSSILREFVLVIFIAVLLWVSAGFQLWLNAWVYIFFLLVFSAGFMAAMGKKNPELLNIRGAPRQAMRQAPMPRYDKVFFVIYVPLFCLIPIFTGLDYQGFFDLWVLFPLGVPIWLVVLGFCLVVFGEAIFGWAMVSNPFFHGMMIIQEERSHQVIAKGPYRWIRHPGYLGQILYYLGTPLFLASWWAFYLGVIMAFLFIYRTGKEDRVLRLELDGYDNYAEQTRKRLIPGLW